MGVEHGFMEKHLWCNAGGRRAKIAWLAFRRNGSIVFMLNPRHAFKEKDHLHSTLHPIAWHHVRERGKVPIFQGLSDYSIMVQQQAEVPWLTAHSNPIADIKESDKETQKDDVENWILESNSVLVSVRFVIDILRPQDTQDNSTTIRLLKHIAWGDFVIRFAASVVDARRAEVIEHHFC
jgi:hypothetical protein